MAYLFKYECRANHPVCYGEVVFFIAADSTKDAMDWLEANVSYYFNHFKENASLIMLGEFTPSIEFVPFSEDLTNVITLQNGEY